MIYLVVIVMLVAGQGVELRKLEIRAKSRQDCIEALDHAFRQPYVIEAKCEVRHG